MGKGRSDRRIALFLHIANDKQYYLGIFRFLFRYAQTPRLLTDKLLQSFSLSLSLTQASIAALMSWHFRKSGATRQGNDKDKRNMAR